MPEARTTQGLICTMPIRERPLERLVHRCIPLRGEKFGYCEQVRSAIQRQSNRRISC